MFSALPRRWISSTMRACTSAGVPRGAHRPYQVVTVYSGKPTAAAQGTSGKAGLRRAPETISALMRPLLICVADEPRPSNIMSTLPAIKSCSAGPGGAVIELGRVAFDMLQELPEVGRGRPRVDHHDLGHIGQQGQRDQVFFDVV